MKLLNATGLSHDQVFGEELRKYEPLQAKMVSNNDKQNALLVALAAEFEKFDQARKSDTAAQTARNQRERVLTELANSYKVYPFLSRVFEYLMTDKVTEN